MKKNAIIIPCKYIEENNTIFECIESLERTNGNDFDIYLVDSDSPTKSYLTDERLKNIKILDIKNKNYTSGALWSVYEINKNYEYYALFHDSMIVKNSIKEFLKDDFISTMYFNSWNGIGHKSPTTYGFDTDGSESFKWMMTFLNKHNVSIPETFNGVFGNAFVASNKLMHLFENKWNLNNLRESSKLEMQVMERLWGIICHHENIDITKNTLIGDLFGEKRTDIIEKRSLQRS